MAPFTAALAGQYDGEGEISPNDYDFIVAIIRRTLSDDGNVGTFGKTLTWTSRAQGKKGRNVFVTIVPRGGYTKIRVEERLGQLAGGLYGGIIGGASGGLGSLAFATAFHATGSWVAGVAAIGGVLLSTFTIARAILGSIKSARTTQIAKLRGELEAEVCASVASPGPQ